MRRSTWTLAGLSILVCGFALAAWGQEAANKSVPRLIRFSGAVRQTGEKPARGVVELSFSLFKEEAGGEPLWFESQTVEIDAQGRYNVLLGAMHPDGIPMDLFTSGEARWLSIMVGKSEQPRVLLVSVPYALKAGDAESLGGKPATAYVATDQLKEQVATAISDPRVGLRTLNTMVMASSGGSDTPPALVNEVVPATFTCTSASACVGVTQNGTGVGLTATSTGASGVTFGMRGQSNSTSGYGVYGYAPSATGITFGVRGETVSTTGRGVFGNASAATGETFGVLGFAASTTGRGVYGQSTATTGGTYGVLAHAASTSGTGAAGHATSATGTTIGVRGIVNSATGTAGVFDNLGGGYIIKARTTGLITRFTVDGSGNVFANGGVSANGQFFGDGSGLSNVDANFLDGLDSSAFAPSVGSAIYVSRLGDVMSGQLVLPANGLAAGGSQMVLASGRVGIGLLNPLAQLDVNGTDATDGSGASALEALLVQGGDGGDQNSSLGTAGNGGSVVMTGGAGGTGLGVDANGGNGGSITLQPGAGGSGDLFAGTAGSVLLAPSGTGSVGIGTSTPAQKLEVNGGMRLNTLTSRPACTANIRGTFWLTQGGAGVSDHFDVCIKDNADAFVWENVF